MASTQTPRRMARLVAQWRQSSESQAGVLAAVVNSTIVAGENLTVGSAVGCRLRASLPAGD